MYKKEKSSSGYYFLCLVHIKRAMNLERYQELTTKVIDEQFLTGIELEKKIIQVCDLCHFIQVYNKSLQVVDYSHSINVIKDDEIYNGVYFFDLLYCSKHPFDKSFYQQSKSNFKGIRNRLNIKELWFVIVVENFFKDDLADSQEFIKQNRIDSLYDKIFYFNFSQSTIKILK